MSNLKEITKQFRQMSLPDLKAIDGILEAEIASRSVHIDGGTSDPDNDGDNDGGIPDDPTHPD